MRKFPKSPGIYCLVFNNGFKIGMSINLAQRIKTYTSPWSRPVLHSHFLKTRECELAEKILIKTLLDIVPNKGGGPGSTEFFEPIHINTIKRLMKEAVEEAHKAYELNPDLPFPTVLEWFSN